MGDRETRWIFLHVVADSVMTWVSKNKIGKSFYSGLFMQLGCFHPVLSLSFALSLPESPRCYQLLAGKESKTSVSNDSVWQPIVDAPIKTCWNFRHISTVIEWEAPFVVCAREIEQMVLLIYPSTTRKAATETLFDFSHDPVSPTLSLLIWFSHCIYFSDWQKAPVFVSPDVQIHRADR